MKNQCKKVFFLGITMLLWATNLFAQAPDILWTRTYGGTGHDYGYSVQQTSDSGYIIAGGTTSFGPGNWDVYLIKTNAVGDTLWTRTYGGTEVDAGMSVEQTSDGGYIVTGSTQSFGVGVSDVYIVRTNEDGDTLWTQTYGGTGQEVSFSIQETFDDGYIIAAHTTSFGAGNWDFYLIKTDTHGDTLWTRTYGGTSRDYGLSVQQTSDTGYIIAGYTWSFGVGYSDVYLIKTNSNGDTFWTRTYGGTQSDAGSSVQQTSDGGYIIAGRTNSFGAGAYDVYLLKTGPNGDSLWARTYGGTNDDYGSSVQQTSDSGYIIAGRTSSFGAGGEDGYVIKTDANGNILWTQTYGGPFDDRAYSVQRAFDGGYIISGFTYSFGAGESDVYLIKTNPVKLTSPNGGEELLEGTIYTVLWWCEHPATSLYCVLLSSDGGISYADTIAKEISEDSTSWDWTVPPTNSPTCCVKVQVLDVGNDVVCEDASDSTFAIRATGVAESPLQVRETFFISQNYPNPFSPQTTIRYGIAKAGRVTLKVYNALGQEVRLLVDEFQQAGAYSVVWDSRDNAGRRVSSGSYFLRLAIRPVGEAGNYTATRKVCVVR